MTVTVTLSVHVAVSVAVCVTVCACVCSVCGSIHPGDPQVRAHRCVIVHGMASLLLKCMFADSEDEEAAAGVQGGSLASAICHCRPVAPCSPVLCLVLGLRSPALITMLLQLHCSHRGQKGRLGRPEVGSHALAYQPQGREPGPSQDSRREQSRKETSQAPSAPGGGRDEVP